jgi:hypothetical protein
MQELKMVAARNQRKSWAKAQSRVGRVHEIKSKTKDVLLLPKRSVIQPATKDQNTCKTMERVAMAPMPASVTPKASMYRDA